MAEQAIINTSTLTSIGDAIRTKTGKTDTFLPSDMPTAILAIETGSDVSGVTAAASDVRSGKKFVDSSGALVNGTLTTRSSSSLSASGATVSVPAGIYDSAVSKSVATATQATPSVSVSSSGLITASCTQSSGYISGSTKSATLQLSSSQDSDFIASNIKSGVTIFGITGTMETAYIDSAAPNYLSGSIRIYFPGASTVLGISMAWQSSDGTIFQMISGTNTGGFMSLTANTNRSVASFDTVNVKVDSNAITLSGTEIGSLSTGEWELQSCYITYR